METAIEIVTDTQIKRKIVGICDKAFMHGITIRKNYEEIFQKKLIRMLFLSQQL